MDNKTFMVVTSALMLGYTRLQGFVVYNSETKSFEEITPAEVRRMIRSGANLHGVVLDEQDKNKFTVDKDFYQEELPVKTACGKFRLLINEDGTSSFHDICYSVVKKIISRNGATSYEVVTNHCARLVFSEEELCQRICIAYVAGVHLDESGNLIIHSSIPVVAEDQAGNSEPEEEPQQTEEELPFETAAAVTESGTPFEEDISGLFDAPAAEDENKQAQAEKRKPERRKKSGSSKK